MLIAWAAARTGNTEMAEHKVKRMNINVEVSLHDAFKAATAAHGDNMTDVLIEFIQNYVAQAWPGAEQGAHKERHQ